MNPERVASACLVCLLVVLANSGCNRSGDATSPEAVQDTGETIKQEQPADEMGEPPTLDGEDLQHRLDEVQAAQQAREYDRTVQLLLSIRNQHHRLTEAQARAYSQHMRSLQSDLATRVAAGDPEAIAAAEKLRASAPH